MMRLRMLTIILIIYIFLQFFTIQIVFIVFIIFCLVCTGWLNSVGSQILYNLDQRMPVFNVIPIQNILEDVPVDNTGSQELLHSPAFHGNHRPGSCDVYHMWFVNSSVLGY
jgi:hypothetical protein